MLTFVCVCRISFILEDNKFIYFYENRYFLLIYNFLCLYSSKSEYSMRIHS